VLRPILALALILSLTAFGTQPADGKCTFCVNSVSLQTRDGQPWSAGKPVTLLVSISRALTDEAMPESALAVVMQTDGDRTKCLDVPLRLVRSGDSTGLYAGLFFPFRAARYDGKVEIGKDVADIAFDVNKIAAGAAPAGDLPAAQPEEAPAAPAAAIVTDSQLPMLVAGATALWLLVAALFIARRRMATRAA